MSGGDSQYDEHKTTVLCGHSIEPFVVFKPDI